GRVARHVVPRRRRGVAPAGPVRGPGGRRPPAHAAHRPGRSRSRVNPEAPTWSGLLAGLMTGSDLSRAEAAWAMDRVMTGEISPVQLGGFLVALRAKGETVDELAGLTDSMVR